MASAHVVVIDTSFRRATVKVTPGKYMTDVLEEACAKLGLNSSQYSIKNNNKPLDLSRTFRQSGLSSGAKLELVIASRSPAVVSVALQLPQTLASTVPGGRLVDKFPSDTTLWLIVRKFESSTGANLNFTGRGVTQLDNGSSGAGRIVYEKPVLNIMGRELSTLGDLQKTLGQLGFNGGSALIRLDFKTTEQPLEQAMEEIREYFKEEPLADSHAESTQTPQPAMETLTNAIEKLPSTEVQANGEVETFAENETRITLPEKQPSLVPTEPLTESSSNVDAVGHRSPEESTKDITGPDHRPITVYSAPSSDTPLAALQPHNENDYEPTIAHAKLYQSRLANNSQNKRLPSDAEAERMEQHKAAKLVATKQVSIKIRFPDQTSIVSPFTNSETGGHLYKYVRDVIAAENQAFKLSWTSMGPQTIPDDYGKLLIKDLKFEGKMLVNFSWEVSPSDEDRRKPVLKKEFVQSAMELTVPEPIAPQAVDDAQGPSTLAADTKENETSGQKSKGGTPKWLKGLMKK